MVLSIFTENADGAAPHGLILAIFAIYSPERRAAGSQFELSQVARK
jgi:hypothetical protein